MSTAQINATHLLCRLLVQTKPEVNGAALLGGDLGPGGHELIRDRLLVIGTPLTYVTCPECSIETARVVRETGRDRILLYCDECGDVDAGRELQQTYTVSLPRFLDQLIHGLGTLPSAKKDVQRETIWRLGTTEPVRAKPLTWYFARHLHDHNVAQRMLAQIRQDKASRSAKVLTSTSVPLPDGSPLIYFDVTNLGAIARLSQNRFVFFQDRAETPPVKPIEPARLHTSLMEVRTRSIAYVDGEAFPLEPMQANILIALMDDYDHRMEANVLREKCRSDADPFQPVKFFGRNLLVYRTFIRYSKSDRDYELIIPDGDRF